MPLPLVAIVGAPNVGKSTLFNRMVGRKRAIVTNEPGVTRDRLYGEVGSSGVPFRLVDTGGLAPGTPAPFVEEVARQADAALAEADLILFVIDARAGATALDRDVAAILRRRGTDLLLVANKIDSVAHETLSLELHELGLGEPIPVSAEHGLGLDLLLERIGERLDATPREPLDSTRAAPALNLAIVGRPNVGKSSLLNRLVGEERVMVSEVPGTTRDAIDTLLTHDGRSYRLIDTAGIRRKGKIRVGVERFSIARARQNIEGCDVAALVLDAEAGFAAQDAHIAGFILDAYKPMLVAVNKWDLVEGREAQAKEWEERLRHRLRFAGKVPLVLISALTGQRVSRIFELADRLHADSCIRVPTPELNRWLRKVAPRETSPQRGASPLRLYYATQTGIRPPRVLIFCNDPRRVHFSFGRHVENSLRRQFGFGSSPIRLEFRHHRERRGR